MMMVHMNDCYIHHSNNSNNNKISPMATPSHHHHHHPQQQPQSGGMTHPNSRHKIDSYLTKVAVVLSMVTLLLLFTLSAVYNYDTTSSNKNVSSSSIMNEPLLRHDSHRRLDDNSNDGDYSKFSCNFIFEKTPTTGSAEQCAFAKTCNQHEGVWAPFLFCLSSDRWRVIYAIALSPVMALWLLVLFRLLGSTAEDYFSPALEMFAMKLGLPPRFAGVTLLALGNGAADVSATIASMLNDPVDGYKMSLGALSGAAMMISCVISAVVIITAQGVPCRGALVRDITALIITVVLVYTQLASGQIGPESISMFLSLYIVFVVLVLVADIYHRAVVVPRLASIASNAELQRQMQIRQDIPSTTILPNPNDLPAAQNNHTPMIGTILSALSNYDATPTVMDDMGAGTGGGWGVESDQFTGTNDRLIKLHGQNGLLSTTASSKNNSDIAAGGFHTNHRQQDLANQSPSSIEQDPDNSYTILQETDMIDNICVQPGSHSMNISSGMNHIPTPIDSWYEAVDDGIYEIKQHFRVMIYDDIINDEEMYTIHKILLICELPFTIARQVTVPIPCEGYYCRGLVALSMILSPIWFVFYLWHGHETNILGSSFTRWMIFAIFELCVTIFALCIIRYAPRGGPHNGEMSLLFATPIALYGFVIAATWIDTIADALVSLLNFIGILLHIPGPVIGLTILAWGNCMSDLSANMTMARKGLANMAMTACFAGPVFNILVGLGLGFSFLATQTTNATTEVTLSPSVVTGFVFIAINGISLVTIGLGFGKGRIPKQFGYLALVVYSIYLIVSISLQYSTTNENN